MPHTPIHPLPNILVMRPFCLSSRRRLPSTVLSALCIVLGVALPASPLLSQPKSIASRTATRIAIWDSRIVLDSMPERLAVESAFAEEQSRARAMVRAASDSLRLALDELVRFEAQLLPREREAAKLNLRARELLVEQMVENLDAVIQQRHGELRQPLFSRIRVAVRTVRVREGYHLAIDRATDGLEMDVDATIDITPAILAELRRGGWRTSQR